MSVIADLIRAGVDPDLVARVADEMADARALGAASARPVRTARQDRNHRYYESTKEERRLKASEKRLNETKQVESDEGGISKEKAPQTPKKENPQSKENPPKGGQKKGFPLPAGWTPSDADWRQSLQSLGIQRAESELSKFRDYWPGIPGEKGRKLDWDGTYRNWVRRAAESAPRAGPPKQRGNELALLAFPELRGQPDDQQQHSGEHQSGEGSFGSKPRAFGSDRALSQPVGDDSGGTLLDLRVSNAGWS